MFARRERPVPSSLRAQAFMSPGSRCAVDSTHALIAEAALFGALPRGRGPQPRKACSLPSESQFRSLCVGLG